jgi:hypothetical protein
VNENELSQYICNTFKGVDVVTSPDNSFFFFYNPDPAIPADHMFPFATLVTSDFHDQFSDLNRPDVFRLNIGVSKQTFRALFKLSDRSANTEDESEENAEIDDTDSDDTGSNYDFTTLDQIMPHPVYGRMYWLCVINPTDETFKSKVYPLLTEAYNMAVAKFEKKHAANKS